MLFSFVERSEQCTVAFMSKGEYVSGLTRFVRACREKVNIKHNRNECLILNPTPTVEFPIILF